MQIKVHSYFVVWDGDTTVPITHRALLSFKIFVFCSHYLFSKQHFLLKFVPSFDLVRFVYKNK